MILRRLGNKKKIAKEIQKHFPAHSYYIEPFFGDIAFASDSTVFITNWYNLDAYSYKSLKLITTAHLDITGRAGGLAVTADSIIFLAAGSEGLTVFSYKPNLSTFVIEEDSELPSQYELNQNYPNPFNPTTIIEFFLPQSSFVTLKVFDLLGKEVATLLETDKPAGIHSVNFNASNLASGLYYCTLTAGEFKQTRKMLLLR